MNDYEYLIKQLNLIIGFLDVSDRQVYQLIKHHDQYDLGISIEQLYENSYDNYSNHITNSAVLLGFAHFEDFITKVVCKLLIKSPDKNEFKVALKTIIERGDKLISSLATEQARRLTFAEKIKFLENNVQGINIDLLTAIRFFNDIRNCLMHNNGLADKRLTPKFTEGQKIVLNSGDVNGYGLQVRQFAKEIWGRL